MGLFDNLKTNDEAKAIIRAKIADFDIETTMKSLVTVFSIMKNEQRADITIDFINTVEGTAKQFIKSLLVIAIDRADASEIDVIVDKARILAETGEWFSNLRILIKHASERDPENGVHGIFTSDKKSMNAFMEETRVFLMKNITKREARKRR